MAYDNIGYNENLTRSENLPTESQQLDPLQFENFAPQISGTKIEGGIIKSRNGILTLDMDNELLTSTNKETEQVLIGKKSDENIGFEFKDNNHNLLMDETGIYPGTFFKIINNKKNSYNNNP